MSSSLSSPFVLPSAPMSIAARLEFDCEQIEAGRMGPCRSSIDSVQAQQFDLFQANEFAEEFD